MPKRLDRILIDLIFVSFVLSCAYYLWRRWVLAIAIAVVAYIAFKVSYMHLLNRRRNLHSPSMGDILFAFSMMTAIEQRDYFIGTLPEGKCEVTGDNTFVYDGKAYATLIKFGAVSLDDCSKIVRKHLKINVVSRKISRDTLLNAKRMGLYVKQVPLKTVRKYLISHNAVPSLPTPTKEKMHFDLKASLQSMLTRKRVKYYALSSLSTLALAFFVPHTVYYLVFAGIFGVLSIGSVFRE